MPFPWPDKSSRHTAIAAARQQKARSQAGAARADQLRLQIEALRDQNHFANAIVEDIIRRHARGT